MGFYRSKIILISLGGVILAALVYFLAFIHHSEPAVVAPEALSGERAPIDRALAAAGMHAGNSEPRTVLEELRSLAEDVPPKEWLSRYMEIASKLEGEGEWEEACHLIRALRGNLGDQDRDWRNALDDAVVMAIRGWAAVSPEGAFEYLLTEEENLERNTMAFDVVLSAWSEVDLPATLHALDILAEQEVPQKLYGFLAERLLKGVIKKDPIEGLLVGEQLRETVRSETVLGDHMNLMIKTAGSSPAALDLIIQQPQSGYRDALIGIVAASAARDRHWGNGEDLNKTFEWLNGLEDDQARYAVVTAIAEDSMYREGDYRNVMSLWLAEHSGIPELDDAVDHFIETIDEEYPELALEFANSIRGKEKRRWALKKMELRRRGRENGTLD